MRMIRVSSVIRVRRVSSVGGSVGMSVLFELLLGLCQTRQVHTRDEEGRTVRCTRVMRRAGGKSREGVCVCDEEMGAGGKGQGRGWLGPDESSP